MVYLDNNATTLLEPSCVQVMQRAGELAFGNPGSRHLAGRRARQVLEDSREKIAHILGALPDEVIFTSGGTESSNLAISGLAAGRQGVVLSPPGEHPASAEPVRRLVESGWQRREIPIDQQGRLVPEAVAEMSLENVRLVTVLLAHNETGVVQDLSALAWRCEHAGIPLHIDAVQAVGKIPINFRDLRGTTLSLGAHKFHGPRGIGALLIRKGTRIRPLLLGGHQEQDYRPGTEPVMLAAGMAEALCHWWQEQEQRTSCLTKLRDMLEEGLLATCQPAIVNGDRTHRLPNTTHIAFPGCDADALLVALDLMGICCSSGSTCASGSLEPSPILLAMQLPPEHYRASLRFSVSVMNTEEEIARAVDGISAAVRQVRERNP
jgi:cysteine desulfurase